MKTLLFGNGVASLDDVQSAQCIDLAPEAVFDDLTRLAACICQTPIAVLSLIEGKQQSIKSQVGLDPSLSNAYWALCTETILQMKTWDSLVLVVEDVLADPQFAHDDLVKSQSEVRFYAAVPLVTPQKIVVGLLAVSDRVGRSLTLQQKEALVVLSKHAISLILGCATMQSEWPKKVTTLKGRANKRQQRKEARHALRQELATLKLALEQTSMVSITDHRGKIQYVNEQFCKLSKYVEEELIGKDHRLLTAGYHSSDFFQQMWVTIARGKIWKGEIRNRAKDGSFYWVNTAIVPILNTQEKPLCLCIYLPRHY
jgi:PAS domain S-box-containing protein